MTIITRSNFTTVTPIDSDFVCGIRTGLSPREDIKFTLTDLKTWILAFQKFADLDTNIDTNTIDIATNAGNITTNTENIATNTGSIATNTANIATNTGDIASLQALLPLSVVDIVSDAPLFGAGVKMSDGNIVTWIGSSGTSAANCGLGAAVATDKAPIVFPNNKNPQDIKQIEIYSGHGWALFNDGELYTWGVNTSGVLGLGDSVTRYKPTLSRSGVNRVFGTKMAGFVHTNGRLFVEDTDGTYWAVGNNSNGNLGLGDTTVRSSWTQITSLSLNSVKRMWNLGFAGGCTFVQLNDNTIWACGYNNYGALGTGSTAISVTTFTDVTANWGGATEIEEIEYMGACYNGTTQYYEQVVLMWKKDGTIRTCGSQVNGRIGNGIVSGNLLTPYLVPLTGTVKEICVTSGRWGIVRVLMTNGVCYSWGYNERGAIGRGDATGSQDTPYTHPDPTNVMNNAQSLMMKSTSMYTDCYALPLYLKHTDGSIWGVGDGGSGNFCLGVDDTGDKSSYTKTDIPNYIQKIFVHGYNEGAFYMLGLDDKGKLWGWGYGARYDINPASRTASPRYSPERIVVTA